MDVDSFFDEYVAELSHRSKREGGGISSPDSKHPRLDIPTAIDFDDPSLRGAQASLVDDPITDSEHLTHITSRNNYATIDKNRASSLSFQQSPFEGYFDKREDGEGSMLHTQAKPHRKDTEDGQMAVGVVTKGKDKEEKQEEPGEEGLVIEEMMRHPEVYGVSSVHANDAGAMAGERRSNGRANGTTRISERRVSKSTRAQEANKAAQQRYRERKKAKFVELESTVAALQHELDQLRGLQRRNQILEGMNTNLQSALVEKEQELDRLKLAMDAQADKTLHLGEEHIESAGGASSSGNENSQSHEDGKVKDSSGGNQTNDSACIPCNVLPRDLTGIDFKTGFHDQIKILRDFMEMHHLNPYPHKIVSSEKRGGGFEVDGNAEEIGYTEDARGKEGEVPLTVIQELAQIVGRCCQLCQAALRAEGVRVFELIERTPEELKVRGKQDGEEQSAWLNAIEAMQLTREQEEQILLLRRSHLEKMRIVYNERQELNLEAMAMMLPHHARHMMEDTTVEGRMNSMATHGYLGIAKSNAELGSVLDKIRDNLRKEQRYVMDLNCCTIARILTP